MKAEILATGDEIRSGALVDSNSAHISQKLEETGISVIRHSCIGDDSDILTAILREIGSRADICIVTGGLGPTSDDLTSESAAKAAEVELAINKNALSSVEEFFKARNFIAHQTKNRPCFQGALNAYSIQLVQPRVFL